MGDARRRRIFWHPKITRVTIVTNTTGKTSSPSQPWRLPLRALLQNRDVSHVVAQNFGEVPSRLLLLRDDLVKRLRRSLVHRRRVRPVVDPVSPNAQGVLRGSDDRLPGDLLATWRPPFSSENADPTAGLRLAPSAASAAFSARCAAAMASPPARRGVGALTEGALQLAQASGELALVLVESLLRRRRPGVGIGPALPRRKLRAPAPLLRVVLALGALQLPHHAQEPVRQLRVRLRDALHPLGELRAPEPFGYPSLGPAQP